MNNGSRLFGASSASLSFRRVWFNASRPLKPSRACWSNDDGRRYGHETHRRVADREKGPLSVNRHKAAHQAKRLVVADDDPDMVAFMTLPLTNCGYDIAAGNDGEEAIDLVRRHRPDLVILDICMPLVDGLVACRRLKEDEQLRHIPVMLITATASLLPAPDVLYALQVDGLSHQAVSHPGVDGKGRASDRLASRIHGQWYSRHRADPPL
jgi:CheY-like chemotaxis protein